jgi:hypothetical protein
MWVAPRIWASSFGSASPGELPHASGLPHEESTDMRVSPQLDFVALLSQPRGLLTYRAYLARRHRHESCPRSWTSAPSQPAQGALTYRAYLARKAPT